MAGSVKISQLPDGSNQLTAQDQIPFVNSETMETKRVPFSDLKGHLQEDIPVSTDELPEGLTNLYYTDPRARNSIQSIDPSLIYDNTTGDFSLAIDPDDFYTTVEFDSDFSLKSTDSLSEGPTNLYYTEERFDVSFSLKTTTDLAEGSNLYYTRSRFDSDLLARGITGGTLSNTDSLAEGSINLYYEDSRVESFVDSSYVQARQVHQVDYVTTVGYNLADPSDSSSYILRTYDGLETSTFRGNVIDDDENVIVDANNAIFSGRVMGVLAGTVTNNSGSMIVLDAENSFLNISDITANGTVDFKDAVVVGAHDSALTIGQIVSTVDSAYVNDRVTPLPETAETVRYVIKAVGPIPVGAVVMFVGASGSETLASVSDQSHPGFIPEHILGISEQDLLNDEVGYITAFGLVSGVNVVGMSNGDTLYDNPLTNGGLLTTEPSPSEGHSIIVATVIDDELFNNGTLHVNVSRRFNTDEVVEGSSNLYYTDDRVNALIDERVDPSQFPSVEEFNDIIDARIDSDDFVDLTSDQIIGGIKQFTDSVDVKSLKVGPDLSDSDKATIVFDIGGDSVQELSATSAGLSLGEYLLITSKGLEPLEQEVNEISNTIAPLNFDSEENLTVNGSIISIGDSGTSAQWTLAYQWGDHALAGYLTSYTETDPTVPQHVKDIKETDLLNYDEAHSWGDHAFAGYLTSVEAETDPTVPQYVKNISETNISNWNEGYGWGNHSIQGYLTNETDPTVPQHVKGITSTQINSWDTAYEWGDHSSAGYATSFNTLTDKGNGTGTYRTSGSFQVGTVGGGMVALTANDGGGNANVTFNHADNTPDHVGHNTGRITVNVDDITGAAMTLSAGSGGVAPNNGLTIYENRITAAGRIDLDDANLQLKQAGSQLRVQTPSGWGGFGPQNTTYCHITTDRSKFYMGEPLEVDGTISVYSGNVSLGGSGSIGAATWANGQFHLGTSASGWAMDPNEFYNSGSGIIGTLSGNLTLNPKGGSIVTSRPFESTSTISASGGNSGNWNTAYGWGNHASAGYAPSSGVITLTCNGTDFVVRDTTQSVTNFIYRDHSAGKLYLGTSDDDVTIRGSSGLSWGNESINQTYFTFIGGAGKRLTTQGGLILGVDSSVILHAGDQVNSLKGTLGITDATTTEEMYVTADGNVHIQSGHQTSGGTDTYAWRFQSDGNLAFPRTKGATTNSKTWMKAVVSGDYGSIEIDGGATGGYEGYSIGGRATFMHDNSNTTGIYNDVNNQWIMKSNHNGQTTIYHAGATKGYTSSDGWRVTGNLYASSNVYAYYSDERLKDVVGTIDNPVDKVRSIETFFYTHNDTARELGYEGAERQIGVSAQSVKEVLPEVIHRAPIDDDGEGGSISGEDYMTVDYPRLVPLLIESIKTLADQVEDLQNQINAGEPTDAGN